MIRQYAVAACLGTILVQGRCIAQAAGGLLSGQRGPQLNGVVLKLFGDHKAFSASVEMGITDPAAGGKILIPAELFYYEGKSRLQIDMTLVKGGALPPEMTSQLKMMGLAEMIALSRPDKKSNYIIYPALKSYVEAPVSPAELASDSAKIEVTPDGEETIEGHACLRTKAVLTDPDGTRHEAMVWKAKDLKNFPVRIDHSEQGQAISLLFKKVKLGKPNVDFDPPTSFARFDNMQTLMREVMLKRLGKGPPGPAPDK